MTKKIESIFVNILLVIGTMILTMLYAMALSSLSKIIDRIVLDVTGEIVMIGSISLGFATYISIVAISSIATIGLIIIERKKSGR